MNLFVQFGLILLVVIGVSILMRFLRQPLMIGYILSGIIVGPIFLNLIRNSTSLNIFSEVAIAFLLFVMGLHLSPKIIREVGSVAIIAGVGQIVFTAVIGYLIAIAFGFETLTAVYIVVALTFSSTIIVMKLLSDKDSFDKLYGKIAIGFILVQDFVAIVIHIVVSSMASGDVQNVGNLFLMTFLKGIGLLVLLVPLSYFLLPKLNHSLAKSQELLFLFSISWGLGVSLLFLYAGFSLEVGALIAGILLSLTPYKYEVSSKLKTFRDFFIISFFIILGSQIVFVDISSSIIPIIVFSLLVIIGNPLIVMFLMGLKGFSKKTSFMSGLTIAQIGEFSFIFIAMGVRMGHISQEVLSFITLVGIITIFGCTYLVMNSDFLYHKLSKVLGIFERKNIKEKKVSNKEYKYVLLGYNRIGFSILKAFSKITRKFLIVDYDPNVIKSLKSRGFSTVYGDVDDVDLLEDLKIHKSSVIVSTIPDMETNKMILDFVKANNSKTVTILTARQIEDALELYEEGASYVILPHFLGGEYTSKLIEYAKDNESKYRDERDKEIKLLKERIKSGHKHPSVDR